MTTEYTEHFRLNLPDFRMGPWHDLVNEDFVMIDDFLWAVYHGASAVPWANSTHYAPGDSVTDPADATGWVCVTDHTSAAAPTTFAADRAAHPAYWNNVPSGGGGSGGSGPPSDAIPLMDGVGSPGALIPYSRGDHRHPSDTSRAPVNSPALTGVPTGPTAAPGVNTIQLATTAFVAAAVTAGSANIVIADTPPVAPAPNTLWWESDSGKMFIYYNDGNSSQWVPVSVGPQGPPGPPGPMGGGTTPGSALPIMDGSAYSGASIAYSREDHIHPSDTSRAPVVSPALVGIPTAPTAAPGVTTTQIATTAYVTAADVALKAAIVGTASTSMDTLGEIETYINGNITPALGNKADLFSPTFTGDPKAPTPAAADNDTSIATTAFVNTAIATAGGSYQPLDGDLTSLAGTSGTNTIYYRSGTSTWTPVTLGGNMTFAGGVLNSTAGGGGGITDAPSDGKTYGRLNATWTDLAVTYQPLDGDLTALAATSGTNTIYYRSAANTWTAVTMGGNMTFSGGVLNSTGGSAVTPAALTKVDDTNVTLTLGGTPATALLQASSLTLGWTGTLAAARGGFGTSVAASNGVPLFATGVATFTGTIGTGNFVRAIDPVFTGNPTAPTPTAGDNDTSIATTAFVTAALAAAVAVSDTPPATPAANSLWWESDTGKMFIRYNDGNSSQWVPVGLGAQGPPGIWTQLTQAQYNALSPPNASTLYVIVG